jgi:CHAT domain-containing protein
MVSDLVKLGLKHAHLVFLSACETTKGDCEQPDQAAHLAATMLFVCFNSVVSTMWRVTDQDALTAERSLVRTGP